MVRLCLRLRAYPRKRLDSGEGLLVSILVVILIPQSREKNLGLSSELIHNRNGPEIFVSHGDRDPK